MKRAVILYLHAHQPFRLRHYTIFDAANTHNYFDTANELRRQMTPQVQEELDKLLTFLGNHVHRMDYPRYLKLGWQIASGAVESACKTVVNQRLCLGGMRWGEPGSDALCHLRGLYRSDPDQWDASGANFGSGAEVVLR